MEKNLVFCGFSQKFFIPKERSEFSLLSSKVSNRLKISEILNNFLKLDDKQREWFERESDEEESEQPKSLVDYENSDSEPENEKETSNG